MNRLRFVDEERIVLPPRAFVVPVVSTIAGSLTALLPEIATAPVLPPVGLLILLGWRLLRPELWPVWAALPLGLADDLFSGQPIGSAMLLWTICFLAIDLVDRWAVWRDYWQEWAIAAVAIAFCVLGGDLIARVTGGGGLVSLVLPQLLLPVALFPAASRICATLDRWRLRQ